MMRAEAIEVACYAEDGVVVVAFNLAQSDAGYVMIHLPEIGGGMEDEFFGSSHYVEVKDQLWGRYGGLSAIRFAGDHEVRLRLTYEVDGVGNGLTIHSPVPFPDAVVAELGRLGLPDD